MFVNRLTVVSLCRYSYMIDNIILLITGTLHQRQIAELRSKCHPLGSFEEMESVNIANTPAELYEAVLVDTPLGKGGKREGGEGREEGGGEGREEGGKREGGKEGRGRGGKEAVLVDTPLGKGGKREGGKGGKGGKREGGKGGKREGGKEYLTHWYFVRPLSSIFQGLHFTDRLGRAEHRDHQK